MNKTGMAILVGCANYEKKDLPPLPQAKMNIVRFVHFFDKPPGFHDVEIKPDDVLQVLDPEKGDDILEALDKVPSDLGFLLLYYCGHGFRVGGKLFLGLTSTRPSQVSATAFPVETIHEWLAGKSQIPRKLVIYDCCHSGAGIAAGPRADKYGATMGSGNLRPPAMFTEADVKSWHVGGAAFWAASAPHKYALAHKTRPFTLFTEELMEVIEDGVDGGSRVLTVGEVFQATKQRIDKKRELYQELEWELPDPKDTYDGGGGTIPLIANRRLTATISLLERLRERLGSKFEVRGDNVEQVADAIVAMLDGTDGSEVRLELDAIALGRLVNRSEGIGVSLLKLSVPTGKANPIKITPLYMNDLALSIHGYSGRSSGEVQFEDVTLEMYHPWIDKSIVSQFDKDQSRIVNALIRGIEATPEVPLRFGDKHQAVTLRGSTFYPVTLSSRRLPGDERSAETSYVVCVAFVDKRMIDQFQGYLRRPARAACATRPGAKRTQAARKAL